ncbi:MAG: DUF1801 domain-containing protein [Pseudoxanthomonas sp.]
MAENKTIQSDASVEDYLAAIADEGRRNDCRELVRMMTRVAGEPARMWGTGIVGFGSYHYRYASGREGDSTLVGFASRKGDISIYLGCDLGAEAALLARLGRHKIGKVCLYLRSLSDVDGAILEQLLSKSVEQSRRIHQPGPA